MDRSEATRLLRGHMENLGGLGPPRLLTLIGEPEVVTVSGESGTEYQIEVEAFWDSEPGGLLRVIGSIDDGTLRAAMSPISEDFLIRPDGTFVD